MSILWLKKDRKEALRAVFNAYFMDMYSMRTLTELQKDMTHCVYHIPGIEPNAQGWRDEVVYYHFNQREYPLAISVRERTSNYKMVWQCMALANLSEYYAGQGRTLVTLVMNDG